MSENPRVPTHSEHNTIPASESAQFPGAIAVTVTAADADNGDRRSVRACPIAIALNREYAPAAGQEWLVGPYSAFFQTVDGESLATYELPQVLFGKDVRAETYVLALRGVRTAGGRR